MVTHNPIPVPTTALRGAVQKTFVPTKILSGFTNSSQFELFAGEYLATLNPQERAQVLINVQATRTFVEKLQPFQPQTIIISDIIGTHVDAIKTDPLFMQLFSQKQYRFCYVNPSNIIALQAWIEPRSDSVPDTEETLLEFALPRTWDISAEISFIPPQGPIQVLSSDPSFQGLTIELDQTTGKVMLGAPKHLNLVQIVHFQDRYFLRNGYHRVADALAAGVHKFPAIVVEASSQNDIALPGNVAFNIDYVLNLTRPPLVQDFHTNAALATQVRERRYGVIVNIDIKPLNIGI